MKQEGKDSFTAAEDAFNWRASREGGEMGPEDFLGMGMLPAPK
jgi:hypothetical protein